MWSFVQVLWDLGWQNFPLLDQGKIREHFTEKSENALWCVLWLVKGNENTLKLCREDLQVDQFHCYSTCCIMILHITFTCNWVHTRTHETMLMPGGCTGLMPRVQINYTVITFTCNPMCTVFVRIPEWSFACPDFFYKIVCNLRCVLYTHPSSC